MSQSRLTPSAIRDMESIHRRISVDNPDAAKNLIVKLRAKYQTLAENPNAGRQRDELSPGLRSLPEGNYVIYYRVIEDGISVVRIMHGARNVTNIFRRGRGN